MAKHTRTGQGKVTTVFESFFASIFTAGTAGIFWVGYILMLGCDNISLAVCFSIPALFNILQPVHLPDIDGLKKISSVGFFIQRNLWIIFLFLPFIDMPNTAMFVIIFFLTFVAGGMAQNSYTHLQGGFSRTNLGLAGTRIKYIIRGLAFGSALLFFAKKLDLYKYAEMHSEGYILVFGIAIFCGFISFLLLKQQYRLKFGDTYQPNFWVQVFPTAPLQLQVSERKRSSKPDYKSILSVLSKNKKLKKILKNICAWTFIVSLSAPFVIPYMMQNLGFNYSKLAILTLISLFSAILPLYLMKKQFFRKKSMLRLCYGLIVSFPLLWLIANRDFMLPVLLIFLILPASWVLINISVLREVGKFKPEKLRNICIYITALFCGLATIIGSVLGGFIAEISSSFNLAVANYNFINYHLLFLLSTILGLLKIKNL